jgi:DNA helicase IV
MVLLQTSPGHYELAGSSSRFSWSDAGSDGVDLRIEIRKATFYVSRTSYSGRCTIASRAQFRLKGDQWRMIGATHRESNAMDRKAALWYSQDANLVTGDEIYQEQGSVKQRMKFSPLLLDLRGFPLDYNKAFRTKAKPVCGQ